MPENQKDSLDVIALISGGKDSLYSILHCLKNGHRVVALANLYPQAVTGREAEEQEEQDIDSYMYQTIGHSIIPLYEKALQIPLYRAPILGNAVNLAREYEYTSPSSSSSATAAAGTYDTTDETESLTPLLKRIMEAHPTATAVSAGAILSTYQRTRIENVAQRLGLTPLAWLWMYPYLPPQPPGSGLGSGSGSGSTATSERLAGLLDDMAQVGCEARIIKVASGGLDERWLWGDVSGQDGRVRNGLVRVMRRFVDVDVDVDVDTHGSGGGGGMDVKGAVLGEGGEYESIALDGPRCLWKGRIVVQQIDKVAGEAGVAAVRFRGEKFVVMKEKEKEDKGGDGCDEGGLEKLRVPGVLDEVFQRAFERGLESVDNREWEVGGKEEENGGPLVKGFTNWSINTTDLVQTQTQTRGDNAWYMSNLSAPEAGAGSAAQMEAIVQKLRMILQHDPDSSSISSSSSACQLRNTGDIVFTTVLLRSMKDFTVVNPIYASLFTKPNPPARVTVACGNALPVGIDVMVSFVVDTGARESRRGLHVQSRSYWAPANIGPYSQAISTPFTAGNKQIDSDGGIVYVAGQIPLHPATMELAQLPCSYSPSQDTDVKKSENTLDAPPHAEFLYRSTLALQHLWRIGTAVRVNWWLGGIAFLDGRGVSTGDSSPNMKAKIAWDIWDQLNTPPAPSEEIENTESEEEPILDVWDLKYGRGQMPDDFGKSKGWELPDFNVIKGKNYAGAGGVSPPPPFLAVQVDELPRGSDIEWQGLGARVKQAKPLCITEEWVDDVWISRTTLLEQGENPDDPGEGVIGKKFMCAGLSARTKRDEHQGEEETIEDKERIYRVIRGLKSELLGNSKQNGSVHTVLYTSCPITEREGWEETQVVPCRSVWGPRGTRFIAGIVLHCR